MTAEIAVANPTGVALAADSAVTIGSSNEHKVYNTVNKIFRVCDEEPVGSMIHNSATYSFAPWETLIKSYRHHYGHVRRPRLVDYTDDFIEFISKLSGLPDVGISHLLHDVENVIVTISEELDSWAESLYGSGQSKLLSTRNVAKKAVDIAEQIQGYLISRDYLDKLDENTRFPTLRTTKFKSTIEGIVNRTFSKPVVSKMLISLLVDIADEIARRGAPHSPESGVVVAGFGVDEYFPVITSFNINTPIDGIVRRQAMRVYECKPGNDAVLIPYAQTDVVELFMDGISPILAKYLSNQIEQTIRNVADAVYQAMVPNATSQMTTKFQQQIQQGTDNVIRKLADETIQWQKKYISGPVVEAIRHLPLDELASLAESMVKNTALRRRVSFDLETVGGPVDVAVISKGDGMVWMERKHYFRPELNSHFFARELRIPQS